MRNKAICKICGKLFTCEAHCSYAKEALKEKEVILSCYCLSCDTHGRCTPETGPDSEWLKKCNRDEDWLKEWVKKVGKPRDSKIQSSL